MLLAQTAAATLGRLGLPGCRQCRPRGSLRLDARTAKDGGKNMKMNDGKEKNLMPVSTAEYNPCGWRAWLNNTTLTLGMQNVFDTDPPFVAGAF